MKKLATMAAALGLLFLVSACTVEPPPGTVFVSSAPPVAEVEVIGAAPGPDFLWIRGFHRWDGSRFAWTPGRWERRPRANAVWVDGRWARHKRGWYWNEGRWK